MKVSAIRWLRDYPDLYLVCLLCGVAGVVFFTLAVPNLFAVLLVVFAVIVLTVQAVLFGLVEYVRFNRRG